MDVAGFCDEHLGSPVAEVLFGTRSLSAVTGVRLADGQEVVVKVRPKSARLRGPIQRPESKKPVEALVTDVIPEEHPEEDEETTDGERLAYEPESEPPPEPGAPA